MIRLLHTADLQLGMPFLKVPGDRGARLRELRLEALDALAAAARTHRVDLVLVAGDFFDANTVEDRVVLHACQRLRAFEVPVLLLPGNHDAAGAPDAVLRRDTFVAHKPPNVHVLDDREPRVLLDGRVVVLPAPLLRRHEVGDTTTHLTAELGRDAGPQALRIGLAHGGVIDFDGERGEAENLIAPDRAERAGLDYLALGDWHGTRRVTSRTWYSGAPEPTNYKANSQGNALLVELDHPGAEPRVDVLKIARTCWLRHAARLESDADVEALEAWFASLADPLHTLVRLELAGTLPLSASARLEARLAHWETVLLELRRRGDGVRARATDDELASLRAEGYVQAALERLRLRAAAGPDAEDAERALELLHRLHAADLPATLEGA